MIENGPCRITKKAVNHNPKHMLPVVDWLSDVPQTGDEGDLVEVQFKNTRKGYYHNNLGLPLEKGVKVVVEANPGVDLGEVVLTGRLVPVQIKKNRINTERYEIRNILRVATDEDLARAAEAHKKEQDTMIKSRQLAKSLGLDMKIGDVEYQGDGSKAIFYYIAEGRVDFRQLIKVYAETFRIRIEMKQIGARQEAGRIGGTGPCGRELCCSTWMTQFSSVGTNAARIQNISLNPQKLAGQCAKLKCCLMYEYDVYADARRSMPRLREPLQAIDGEYFLVKSDILAHTMTFSTSKDSMSNLVTIPTSRVREILAINRNGGKVDSILGEEYEPQVEEPTYRTEEDSITRFDKAKKRKKKKNRNNRPQGEQGASANGEQPKEQQPREQKPANEGGQNNGGEGNKEGNREGNRNSRRNRNHRHNRPAKPNNKPTE